MSWGAWMVAELSATEDLRLRQQELELHSAAEECPEAVASLAGQLLRQSMMYESILKKATRHIAALEAKQALQDYEMEKAKAQQRPKWWISRWWV